ncbi:MAG: D-aminoacylase [Candidatus Ryanbacteria bacterium]|nr:D-aminoacylase [Candidatus Ryanbacteria bacterium]
MAAYSYIIKGGTIIDGSGFPMYRGDVGISGEIIKEIGSVGRGRATRVIDAAGKYIVPGFIDVTNHSDTHWTLFTYPAQENLLAQGITTIIGGVCGSSLAPLVDQKAISSVQKWTDASNFNINWRSMEEFYGELDRHPMGVNVGSMVGYSTLRHNITDDDARELTHQELESMKMLLKRSLDEGAFGLSIGLAHIPNTLAIQEEIVELTRIVANEGKVISVHMRNEGRRLLSSVAEVINIARSSGAQVHIAHFKAIGRKAWQDFPKALTIIRKARKYENLPISADFFPYLRTGSLLSNLLPEWIMEGDRAKILATLSDPHGRETILEAIRSITLHYDNIVIAEAQKDKKIIGKTITQIATQSGLSPEETLLQILVVNGLSITIFSKTLKSRHLVTIAKEPYSMFASDGVGDPKGRKDLTHPRSYGAAPRYIDRLVRKSKVFSWEEAIKRMTAIPAAHLGIAGDRGSLKKGALADIVIIDPDGIHDTATYSAPYQYPKGIEYVFINGRLAIEKGAPTGALAGKILRRG